MKKFWPDFSYELYERACGFLEYPKVPFGSAIDSMIGKEDVVVDVGCGMGIPAMYVSSLCRKVIGVDQDQQALDYLKKQCISKGIHNIDTICGLWPEVDFGECDLVLAFYVFHFAESKEELALLRRKVRKGGIIVSHGQDKGGGFHQSMAKDLGLPPRTFSCSNGCYQRGLLEMNGFSVECEEVIHEFGQPVKDQKEAVDFFLWQLRLPEDYRNRVEEIAEKYLEWRKETLYIPMKKNCCILSFRAR